MNKELEVLTNERDDEYTIEKIDFSTQSKKGNNFMWDEIDDEVQETIEKIASKIGLTIEEWGELDLIKETVEFITGNLEKRFDVKFPYVDEDR